MNLLTPLLMLAAQVPSQPPVPDPAVPTVQAGRPQQIPSTTIVAFADAVARGRKSCGPRAAYYCFLRLGHQMPYDEFTHDITVEEDGVSLDDVHRMLVRVGLPAEVVQAPRSELGSLPLPCIIVINPSHCLVVNEIDAATRKAIVFDPSTSKTIRVPLDVLQRSWTGGAVLVGDLPPSRWQLVLIATSSLVAVLVASRMIEWIFRHYRRRTTPSLVSDSPAVV